MVLVPGCDGTAGRQRFGYAHRRRSGQRLERRLRHTVGSAQPAVVRLWGCGANTVTLTVTDVNGNTAACPATVTVEDNIAPVVCARM
ncbi:MAG: hypothetical protein H6566_15870 [Lewinellaceae bacterium]|nr:hypothetical protein [Lewinellaceae bacterium]